MLLALLVVAAPARAVEVTGGPYPPVATNSAGPYIMRLVGSGLDYDTTYRLTRPGEPDIVATEVRARVNTGGNWYVEFDMTGVALGAWDLEVTGTAPDVTLPGAVTVSQCGTPGDLYVVDEYLPGGEPAIKQFDGATGEYKGSFFNDALDEDQGTLSEDRGLLGTDAQYSRGISFGGPNNNLFVSVSSSSPVPSVLELDGRTGEFLRVIHRRRSIDFVNPFAPYGMAFGPGLNGPLLVNDNGTY